MFIILILGFCPLVTRTSGGFRLNCYLFTVKGGFVTRFREEKDSIYNRMLLIPGTGNGERGTGNGSLGTNVQRQPA